MSWSLLLGVAAGVSLLEITVFVGLYAGRSRWRSTAEGIALMGTMAVLGAIFGLFLISRLVGGLGLPTWAVALSVCAVLFGVWLVLLVRAQRRQPR